MDAFHSFWSVPNSGRNKGKIDFPDFEILTSILSVLKWQEFNGKVKLITDSQGYDYFRSIGLDELWDSIETSLDGVDKAVDPFLFWAAGKLYALKSVQAPCVMLDTDLIIWKDMSQLWEKDIVAAHYEELNPYVYPPKETFKLKKGYNFPDNWDFSINAANTAFLYIKDEEFKNHYVDSAIRFFNNIEIDGLNPITAMCFAEQRVLPMCAKEKSINIEYLLDLQQANEQDFVTHTWGFKQLMRDNPKAREELCMRCVKHIVTEYPDKVFLLQGRDDIKAYYNKYIDYINEEV